VAVVLMVVIVEAAMLVKVSILEALAVVMVVIVAAVVVAVLGMLVFVVVVVVVIVEAVVVVAVIVAAVVVMVILAAAAAVVVVPCSCTCWQFVKNRPRCGPTDLFQVSLISAIENSSFLFPPAPYSFLPVTPPLIPSPFYGYPFLLRSFSFLSPHFLPFTHLRFLALFHLFAFPLCCPHFFFLLGFQKALSLPIHPPRSFAAD